MRYHIIPTVMLTIKNMKMIGVSKRVVKLESSYVVDGNGKTMQLLWKTNSSSKD